MKQVANRRRSLIPVGLILALLGFISCEKDKMAAEKVAEAIENEIVNFEEGTIPDLLKAYLAESKIMIFGETHFVQQHQDFIALLLPTLSTLGYRVIFEEQFHCFNWMIEDYISGDLEELPEFLLYFDAALIEGIKEFNRTVDDSLKFKLVYMDVNNWRSNFVRSLDEIELILGPQSVFSAVRKEQVDSEPYRVELQNLMACLKSDSVHYIEIWGRKWYDRVIQMIPVEIVSSGFRSTRDDELREAAMYDNITRIMEEHPDSKFLINTGMFHGQKTVYMGTDLNRIGKRLAMENDKTFSIVFVGMKGERKQNFADETNLAFDLSQSVSPDDIIRQINEQAPQMMALLPFSNEVFSNQLVKITYIQGTTVNATIGRQFDAVISYPDVSVLESMNRYNWQ